MIRVNCIVPGCRCTRGRRKGDKHPLTSSSEWICAKHWKGLNRADKAENRHDLIAFERSEPTTWEAWDRLKAEAIEKAAGL